MNVQSDDFALFGLPRTFRQDIALIDARRLELQRLAHPDQFADQGASAQRLAMQWSMRINEGWQRLKNPLKRAAYLCDLGGAPVHANAAHRPTQPVQTTQALSPEFLDQQMAWREDLEAAQNVDDVMRIGQQVHSAMQETLQNVERWIDDEQDLQAAGGQVRILMFLQHLADDIRDRMDALDERSSDRPAA